jgi:hypothetical protein
LYELKPDKLNPGASSQEINAEDEEMYQKSQTGRLTAVPSSFAYLPVSKICPDEYRSELRKKADTCQNSVHPLRKKEFSILGR